MEGDFTGLAIDTYGDARNNIIINSNPSEVKVMQFEFLELALEVDPI